MFIFLFNLKRFLIEWKRLAVFAALIAALAAGAGLLGARLLYGGGALQPVNILIVDEDDTLESRAFYEILTNTETYKKFVTISLTSRGDAVSCVRAGEADAAFIVAKGFTERIKNGENMPYDVVYNAASPVRATVIGFFSDAFTDMLRVSQTGVYAGLDYAREYAPGEYGKMFTRVNMRYMNLIMNRADLFEEQVVSAAGKPPVAVYYAVSAYVFVMLAGVMLFADMFMDAYPRRTILALCRAGTSPFAVAAANAASYFAALLAVNVLLAALAALCARALGFNIFTPETVRAALVAAFVFLPAVSLLGTLFTLVFSRGFTLGVFVSVTGLAALFLSGGVIPADFMPSGAAALGRLTVNYHAVRMILGALTGEGSVLPMAAVCALLAVLTMAAAWRGGRAGGSL